MAEPDEAYPPLEIPEYGLRAQPQLARHARGILRLVGVGLGLAVVSLVCALIAVVVFPSMIGEDGQNESRIALWCALGMVLIVGYQLVAWYVGWLEWSAKRDFSLTAFARVSFAVHLVSYAVVLVGMWFTLTAMVFAGPSSAAFWLLTAALFTLVMAQIVGATEFLRSGGPSGTVPAHIRRLVRFNETRNERA